MGLPGTYDPLVPIAILNESKIMNKVCIIFLSFLLLTILQSTCSRHTNRIRITCVPVQKEADETAILYADFLNDALKQAGNSETLVYPLDWYFYSLNTDSLANREYILPFAKRIDLDYLVTIGHSVSQDSNPQPWKLVVLNVLKDQIETEMVLNSVEEFNSGMNRCVQLLTEQSSKSPRSLPRHEQHF